jgi:hypothetical protein
MDPPETLMGVAGVVPRLLRHETLLLGHARGERGGLILVTLNPTVQADRDPAAFAPAVGLVETIAH